MKYKLLLIFALILIPTLAFVALFGSYLQFDDEGYSIAVIRGVADGIPLYTKQFDFHGPLPFLAKALIFRSLGIPVTQESMRFWVLGIWMLSCCCLSAAIWHLTREPLTTAAAVLVTGIHLFALRFNPGHPEDFVVLFLSLSILVAAVDSRWMSDNLRVALLAAIAGILTATKINVGLFFLFGLALWMLASFPRRDAWKASALLFTIAVTAFPTVLMRSFLAEFWQLAVCVTLGILVTCTAFLRLPIPARFGWRQAGIAVGSFGAVIAAVLILCAACGSRIGDVVDQTVLVAAKHSALNIKPIFSLKAIPATLICVVVTWIGWRRTEAGPDERFHPSPAIAKVALSLTALSFVSLMHFAFYTPFLGPICWLMVFPDGRNATRDRSQSGRLFLASIAVFQTMQVFPIAGAQTSWSTLAFSVCGLVLLHDGLIELSLGPARILKFATRSLQAVAGVTILLVMIFATTLWFSYWRSPSIGFGGSNLIRIPMATTAEFDWVVANVGHYCDALVTQPGLDSFVLWSSKPGSDLRQRSPVLLVDWPFTMPGDRQQRAADGLAGAGRVCGVYSKRLSDWWTDELPSSAKAQLPALPLVSYLHRLDSIRVVGDYEIRGNQTVKETWTADLLLDGERNLENNRSAVGVPASLLVQIPSPVLIFDFETHAAGPLVSVQSHGRGTDSDEQPFATEALAYINDDGRLSLRTDAGVYVAGPAKISDGRWHELQLRRESSRWIVSVDGIAQGSLDEFLSAAGLPHYLQLGPAYLENCPELGHGWHSFEGKLRDVRVVSDGPPFALSARAAN